MTTHTEVTTVRSYQKPKTGQAIRGHRRRVQKGKPTPYSDRVHGTPGLKDVEPDEMEETENDEEPEKLENEQETVA